MMKTKVFVVGMVVLLIGVFFFALLRTAESPSPEPVTNPTDAIDAVIAEYPELAMYKTTSLPPSSIEAKPAVGGWYVGFIREGSGVSGVLDAKCYFVATNADVAVLGEYVRGTVEAADINIETCTPILSDTDTGTTPSGSGVDGVAPDEGSAEPGPDFLPYDPAPIPDEPGPAPITSGGCYRGGCSGQICSDEPNAISTCEYRPEYSCYKTAACERQSNGQCGWTQDAALRACLANPGDVS